MDNYIFKQLEFIRDNTLNAVENSTDEMANKIPEGFRNNIRWHLGHIYYSLESYAFDPINLPMILPNDFKNFFANGTSPLNWNSTTPSVEEITSLLRAQPGRVRSELKHRLLDKVDKPFIHRSGRITLETVGEFLSFNLYHEGMHLNSIKNYKSLYNK